MSALDDLSSGSSDYAANSWVTWFLSTKGNEYFCEVDEEYILDRFNLTGLNAEVQNYPQALDLITDALEEDLEDEARDHVENQARLLYGLVHARFIVTTRGLQKMVDKYKRDDFGRCPRVLCYQQALLPVGLSDLPFHKAVKLFCPRCEDIYSPKSSRHGTIDGAFFGSTFPHMLFMAYPHLLPSKSPSAPSPFLINARDRDGYGREGSLGPGGGLTPDGGVTSGAGGSTPGPTGASGVSTSNAASKVERYRPRIFGFPTHETAKLHRWQEAVRDLQIERLERSENRQALLNAQAHHSRTAPTGANPPTTTASGHFENLD
ncbi:hypothetical protein IE81DRAFT_112276 [Ceraceosorus guamensis]|uniref:Casein kinase II subunit beta n=1 Tax=Ceraceosorus guamensis TaxID=1522189 RepID=A0A316W5H9_9BASI|nr:hypothetical protein IE81DRAFT_112276 [Ceraceosorus guamensis]PWN42905.1 hypothetical protein IE81DRAFT_112276 [Ceraceosorus guamensis]